MRNPESRDERTARLHAEGRLDEFNERLDALKRGTKSKCQTQLAYWRCVSEFLPLAAEKPAGEPADFIDPAIFRQKTATKTQAIQWTADHVGIKAVEAKDSPSADSWNLLSWVRASAANAKTFWSSIFPLIVPVRPARGEEDKNRFSDGSLPDPEAHRRTLQMIEQITEEVYGGWWPKVEATLIGSPEAYLDLKPRVEEALAVKAATWISVPGISVESTARNRILAAKIQAALPHLVTEPMVIEATPRGTDPAEQDNGRHKQPTRRRSRDGILPT